MKTANRSSNKRESSYGITGRAFNAEIDPLIAVIDLRKRFKSLEVLKGIDLYIKQGSVTVLIGPSGSGKSTLLRCINQLEPSRAAIFSSKVTALLAVRLTSIRYGSVSAWSFSISICFPI